MVIHLYMVRKEYGKRWKNLVSKKADKFGKTDRRSKCRVIVDGDMSEAFRVVTGVRQVMGCYHCCLI